MQNELIKLFAETEALHEPIRNWANRRSVSAIFSRRAAYPREGIPWCGGGTGEERIEAHRRAAELEKTGVVIFIKSKGKRVGWRLSEAEYWRLRWLCLLTGEAELAATMLAMLEAERDGCTYGPGPIPSRLVPEWRLCQAAELAYDKCGALTIEERLMPGLCLGLVDSASDCEGRVYYEITAAGDKWIERFNGSTFSEPSYNKAASNRAADLYLSKLLSARAALAALQSETHEVTVPLSCGFVPKGAPA